MIQRIINKLKRVKFGLYRFDPIMSQKISKSKNAVSYGDPLASWTIPNNEISEDSICYLVGAGENISFDIALANTYKSKVFIFDPTPRAIAHFDKLKSNVSDQPRNITDLDRSTLSNITFVPVGIWKENTTLKFYSPENPLNVSHSVVNLQNTNTYFEAKVNTISSLMEKFSHKKIDILKIDIEGAEYEVIKAMVKEKVFPDIVCIEYDEVFSPIDEKYKERIKESLNLLIMNDYKIYHLDYPSNYTLVRTKIGVNT